MPDPDTNPAAAPAAAPAATAAPPAAPNLDAVVVPPSADDAAKKRKTTRKGSLNVAKGVAHVHATFNNTKVCITDLAGNVLAWSSAGKVEFKGSRKSTAYAAQVVATDVARRVMALGLREVEVQIKGPGAGRESAVRGLVAAGLEVSALRDVTPIPHNGCRPPKRRRV